MKCKFCPGTIITRYRRRKIPVHQCGKCKRIYEPDGEYIIHIAANDRYWVTFTSFRSDAPYVPRWNP